MTLSFHPLTLADREAMQAVTLLSGRRNCNFTFANLVGWQFLFNTEVCVLRNAVVLRYTVGDEPVFMVCAPGDVPPELIGALLESSSGKLTIVGLEDSQATAIKTNCLEFLVETVPLRNQYDYIYRRADLASLHGGMLKAKRNHVNRFREEHPDFEYRWLSPELFDECRRVTEIWQEEKDTSDTIAEEKKVMETVFAQWDELRMMGGSIFTEGRMVAFTYGNAVTNDTFDICVEKADRRVEGAFAVINQQFAEHLPEQYVYINREEDMGLPGLRKAKLSYHPEILLTYNVVHITKNDRG